MYGRAETPDRELPEVSWTTFLGSGLDYHIGVVSTDLDDPSHKGKLQNGGTPYKYIDTDTPNRSACSRRWRRWARPGSGTERGIGTTYNALETYKDTFNAGFQRDEARCHTIVVSDESDLTQASVITEPEFIRWYDGIKEEADERTFSSVVDLQTGTSYIHVTNEIGGILWNIREENYAQVLELLGVQAAGLKREYFLSQIPVSGTIDVDVIAPTGITFEFEEAVTQVDDEGLEELVGDWTYSAARNSITFLEYIPDELSKIVITYTIQSTVQDSPDSGTVATRPARATWHGQRFTR
jgi:hypothetical protein